MTSCKCAFKALLAGIGMLTLTGCTCVSFYPAGGDDEAVAPLSGTQKYQIVNAETILLDPMHKTEPLNSMEFNLLSGALVNAPGNDFGKRWDKNTIALAQANGSGKILTGDTEIFKISCRVLAPVVFDNTSDASPVQIKSVIVLCPTELSAWWLTGYLLSLSMSPMRESGLGVAAVSVLNANGKTIGSKVIVFRRSYWVSGLLPTALWCGGKYSSSQVEPDSQYNLEQVLLYRMVAQAAVSILESPTTTEEKWLNIRNAAMEAIIAGNTPAAVTLLNNSRQQGIGGEDCKNILNLIE